MPIPAARPRGAPTPPPSGRRRIVHFIRQFALVIGVLVAVLFGLLVEMAQLKRGAGWLGVRDCTTPYLVGTIVVGLIEVLREGLLLKSGGRWTRLIDWLAGLWVIWLLISTGVLLGVLGSSVPRWLPATFIAYTIVPGIIGMCLHWSLAKKLFRAEFSDKKKLEDYPLTPRYECVVGIVCACLFSVAGCVLLLT